MEHISDAVFTEKVLKNKKPAVVDFYADWCGPCKMLAPVIENVSKELLAKAEFFKINVDENRSSSSEFEVRSIPTIIIFVNGKEKDRLVGYFSNEDLKRELLKIIG